VLVLEEFQPDTRRHLVGQIETMYIASLREIGHRLTNVAKGGEGGGQVGYKHTSEAKAAIADAGRRACKPETRARIAEKALGNTRGLGAKHPHSEETKTLLSALNKGKPSYERSEETRTRNAVANRGRVRSPEMNERNSLAQKAAWARRKAAKS
jgi:hypothetical protein